MGCVLHSYPVQRSGLCVHFEMTTCLAQTYVTGIRITKPSLHLVSVLLQAEVRKHIVEQLPRVVLSITEGNMRDQVGQLSNRVVCATLPLKHFGASWGDILVLIVEIFARHWRDFHAQQPSEADSMHL